MRVPISSVAEMLNVHQRTLRLWNKEGIVEPERSAKNRRLYTEQNIEEARAVSFMLNEMGLNINGVKCLLSIVNDAKKIKIYQEIDDGYSVLDSLKDLSERIGLTPEQMQANKQSNKSKGRKKKDVC